MIEGKEIRINTAGMCFFILCMFPLFSPLFRVFILFLRDKLSLTPQADLFQRSFSQWDLSLHTGVFTNAEMK